jgi:hypothetical protein
MNVSDFGQGLATIVGLVITVAIVSVIVARKSSAPALVQSSGTTLAKVISAAVAPAGNAANNGNNGSNTFTTPTITVA